MNRPSEAHIQELLTNIINSPEFHDSKRYQELLLYLVGKTSSVETLKEAEIAHELFGKDSKFDPASDPLIRSYISNLRKKLEHYYLTTSDTYDYRFEIPRGQYLISFVKTEDKSAPKKLKFNTTFIYIGIIVALTAMLLWLEIGNSALRPAKNPYSSNPVWKEFVASNLPTLVVLGDYLILSDKQIKGIRNFLRVPSINSEAEFADSIKSNRKKYGNFEISKVPFLSTGSTMGALSLLRAIGINEKVSFKLSREITWADIEKNNIIFVGTLKSLYKIDTILARTNIRYSLEPNRLTVHDEVKKVDTTFSLQWVGGNYERNFGLIFKQRLTRNNNVILLTGFSSVGVMDAVKTSIDPDFMQNVKKFTGRDYSDELQQFMLILESEGLEYNVLKSRFKYFENF